MEDIATIDLQQYIKKELFVPETERQEIRLHNLPNTSFLFDIINKLREKHKDDTFVIKQNINITNKKINKEINFSNCIFCKKSNLKSKTTKNNVISSYKEDYFFDRKIREDRVLDALDRFFQN